MGVLITGASGMVGEAVLRAGFDWPKYHLLAFTRKDGDLRLDSGKAALVRQLDTLKPEAIIHLAARVGGIVGNSSKMYEYYFDNIKINTNVIDAAVETNTRIITLSSTCVYPVAAKIPIEEGSQHSGTPEKTNFGYAFAKRMIDVQLEAARSQYGYDKYSIVYPSNLYGYFDRYGEEAHVVPALIDKFLGGVMFNKPEIVLKGTGSPFRQMTYVDDLGRFLMRLLASGKNDNYNFANPESLTIKQIAEKIAFYTGYAGQIKWDGELDGVFRKDVSIEKFKRDFEFDKDHGQFVMTPFDVGVHATIKHRKSQLSL